MELNDTDWRCWPPPGGSAAPPLDPEPTKVAAESPEVSLEALTQRAVAASQAWSADLPPGLEKVAALREDGSSLPPPSRDNLWRHPHAHPAALCLLLLERYGNEMMEWDPKVLLTTLERDGIQISNANRTRVLAARVVLFSPSPWRQWEVFHWTCLGLAGLPPNFVYLETPEMGHLVAGWDFMQLVDPPRETSDEVDKFIAATFKNDGLPYIPPPLDFAQRELEDAQIKCEGCGAVHRNDNDVRCVTCGSTKLTKVPYEYAGLRDEVRGLWDRLRKLPLEQAVDRSPDSPAGNAVYRLLLHWDYASRARVRLAKQLRMLGGR